MSNITTTAIKDNGKTVAYVIPADDYKMYQELEELEELENTELAKSLISLLKVGLLVKKKQRIYLLTL